MAVSNWDDGTAPRKVQVAIYPAKPIPARTTLSFTIGGIAHTVNSGTGIDLQGAILDIPVTALNAAMINAAAGPVGNVPVDWTSGGVTYHGFMDYVPASVGGGGVAGKSVVLQEAVAGSSSAGVATLTLPTDYATYKKLSVSYYLVLSPGFRRTAMASISYDIPMLAAQTGDVKLYIGDDIAHTNETIGWNSSRRILAFTRPAQGYIGRIIYAEIHD